MITVAATDRAGDRATYSNFGSKVDLAAPGGDGNFDDRILSTVNVGLESFESGGDSYAYYRGTSMAAPHVSAVAALIYQLRPNANPDEVELLLKENVQALGSCSGGCGTGLLDAFSVVNSLAPAGNLPPVASYSFEKEMLAVQFQDSSSDDGGLASWLWNFDDGTASTQSSPLHTYTKPGTYHVSLTVTDDQGLSDTTSKTISVDDGTSPSAGGFDEVNLSANNKKWLHFDFPVPAGAQFLSANISGGSGDADLYIRFAEKPSKRHFDCRPFVEGSDESCLISSPNSGTWYISIHAYRAFSGLDLNVSWSK